MSSVASRPAIPSSASTGPTLAEPHEDDEDLTIRFTNVQSLFRTINSTTTSDVLIVTHVAPNQFAKIERERDKRRRKFRFRRYDSDPQILIIALPTKLLETPHLALYQRYEVQVFQRGMDKAWDSVGHTTFRRQHHPKGDTCEGDSTGLPYPERREIDDWPTLVVEAGHSESFGGLHDDMRWWFSMSNHDVRIVILAKFDHRRRCIRLEKWEEEEWHPQGVITRSRAALQQRLAPVLRQVITITRDATTDPASFHVNGGELVLGFKLLFLRGPGPGEGEGDFVITVQELQKYAERVWELVQDR